MNRIGFWARLMMGCAMLTAAGAAAGCAAMETVEGKPTDLPTNYRDLQIYATSEADADDPGLIEVTVHLVNRGRRTLPTHIRLSANAAAGFEGAEGSVRLMRGAKKTWTCTLRPPDGMTYEILTGEIAFGDTRARELHIAVQGADPEGDIPKGVERIDEKARVVGTHAPRLQIDWWQKHRSSSIHPDQRVGPLITLAEAGKTDYVIVAVVMPSADDGGTLSLDEWAAREGLRPGEDMLIGAVRDLQRCVSVMSGGGEMRVERGRAAGRRAIVLALNPDVDWPHNDSYHLKTTRDGDVRIEAGELDGLRQGIYGLLTGHLDCHWFMPGEMGEEIPQPEGGRVVIGQIDERRSPTFFSGFGTSWGSHRDWDCRNRSYINRGRMVYGHAWTGFVSEAGYAYDEFPDMWARGRDGNVLIRRHSSGSTNFCSTSPEVIEIVARKVNERLRDPNALVTSLDPNDYAPMCLCDRCLALDASYGVTEQDGTYVTDRLIHFSNEIYDRMDEENKEKFLGILVYAFQIELPTSAVPHPNHAGMVCNMGWTYDHTRPFTDPTDPTNREFYELIKGWGELLGQFGYYDYYGHWAHFGPWGQVQKMREDLVAFRDLGGTYLMLECQPNFPMAGLNHYISGRLSWDVDADVDVLLEEFFTKFYGPAAGPMRSFWMDIEKYYALLRAGPHGAERVRHTPGMWEALRAHLDEAQAITASLPAEQKRFADRIEFTRDGFEMGWRQYNFEVSYTSQKADAQETLAAADEHLMWLTRMKEKYAPGTYWPTYLPSYYYARVEKPFAEAKTKAAERLSAGG
ncbi:MAG: hypothetical protein CMJ49_11320 [Planctomycetaceae bacterium]|nr:hypothetical protein [Planctomycetaceae bacterium]